MKYPQSGLTLMEMLVVVVMVSMVSALLLQSTMYLFGNFERISSHQARTQADLLPVAWYRDSVAGMVAMRDAELGFAGSAESIAGLTMSPLFDNPGKLTKVTWSLNSTGRQVELLYREGVGDLLVVRRWPAQTAKFSFVDAQGERYKSWMATRDDSHVLPARVQLEIQTTEGERRISAAVKLRTNPPLDYRDFL